MSGLRFGLSLSMQGRGGKAWRDYHLFANGGVAQDRSILVIGDSTSNQITEWPYLLGEQIATLYPEYTVDYRLYDGSSVYGDVDTIAMGTGAATLSIWNASIAGATTTTLRGAMFDSAIGDLEPDLIIFNLGHNLTGTNSNLPVQRGQLMALMEQVMLAHPGVPQWAILQNPWRDSSDMDTVIASWRHMQTLRPELRLINVHDRFIALGKDASLYADSIHPNAAGEAIFVDEIRRQFSRSGRRIWSEEGKFIAWLTNRAAKSISVNGDFAAFSSSVPDGFVLQGTGAILTKETTHVFPGKPYSVKLVNGSTASHLRQPYTSGTNPTVFNAIKGQKATLAVRHYISSDGTVATGTGRTRLLAEPPTGGGAIQDNSGLQGLDGWRWDVISGLDIPADLTLVWIMDYPNIAGNLGNGTIYIDEMRLFVGEKSGA